jgi:hypothetical protein
MSLPSDIIRLIFSFCEINQLRIAAKDRVLRKFLTKSFIKSLANKYLTVSPLDISFSVLSDIIYLDNVITLLKYPALDISQVIKLFDIANIEFINDSYMESIYTYGGLNGLIKKILPEHIKLLEDYYFTNDLSLVFTGIDLCINKNYPLALDKLLETAGNIQIPVMYSSTLQRCVYIPREELREYGDWDYKRFNLVQYVVYTAKKFNNIEMFNDYLVFVNLYEEIRVYHRSKDCEFAEFAYREYLFPSEDIVD